MKKSDDMTFWHYGRAYHLVVGRPEDLAHAVALDEAHWVATSAPADSIHCDPALLALLDADASGRISCREIKQAITWLLSGLSDYRGIAAGADALAISSVNGASRHGGIIRAAAGKILARMGAGEHAVLTLRQVRRVIAEFEAMPVSEAGVVLPAAADGDVARFISDAVAATGGAPHPSGQPGLDADCLDRFLAGAAAVLEWRKAGRLAAGQQSSDILPLGEATGQAATALEAVRPKIDQYFAQCRAVAVDERFARRMALTDAAVAEVDIDDPAAIDRAGRAAPLAGPSAEAVLSLSGPVNPYYADALAEFRAKVVAPVLGEDPGRLDPDQWRRIKQTFQAHKDWLNAKPQTSADRLDDRLLAEYLAPRYADTVRSLIADSAAAALELDNIRMVEKLILLQSEMMDLVNNFVSFPHLYDPARRAMFEAGTLVMDARRFNLAVRVADRAAHARIAAGSGIYILYVEVTPGRGGAKYELAVPVTAGSKGNLCVGKRGVFHDLAGAECDAVVVHIIENPISMHEAIVSPFRRLGRLLTGKIESLTAQADKKLDTAAAAALATPAGSPARSPARPMTGLAAGGMLMGAGVGLAALGSALAYVAKTVSGLDVGPVIIGLLAVVAAAAALTAIVALRKLTRRDLSAILEASGWAVNAPMRLTRRQRNYFTQRPSYPAGAKGIIRRGPWLAAAVLAVIVALAVGGYVLNHARAGEKPVPASSAPTAGSPAAGPPAAGPPAAGPASPPAGR